MSFDANFQDAKPSAAEPYPFSPAVPTSPAPLLPTSPDGNGNAIAVNVDDFRMSSEFMDTRLALISAPRVERESVADSTTLTFRERLLAMATEHEAVWLHCNRLQAELRDLRDGPTNGSAIRKVTEPMSATTALMPYFDESECRDKSSSAPMDFPNGIWHRSTDHELPGVLFPVVASNHESTAAVKKQLLQNTRQSGTPSQLGSSISSKTGTSTATSASEMLFKRPSSKVRAGSCTHTIFNCADEEKKGQRTSSLWSTPSLFRRSTMMSAFGIDEPLASRNSSHLKSSIVGKVLSGFVGVTSTPIPASDSGRLQLRTLADDSQRQPLRKAYISYTDWFLGTPRGQWLLLFLTGATMINIGAFVWKLFCGNADYDRSWIASFWASYCLFIDPGTQTGLPPSDPHHVKMAACVLSFLGFCFNMSFLGMIVELVKATLLRWKKERFRIVFTGHVLILGWTDKTLFLLSEMLEQTEKPVRKVVILAMRDESEMRKDISTHFHDNPRLMRKIIVCHGCPYDVDDLDRVSAGSALDIIVLCRKGTNSDLEMVRMMVALAALPQECTGKVFAEVWDAEAEPVLEVLLSNTDGISARTCVRSMFCLMALRPAVGKSMMALCSSHEAVELRVVEAAALTGKTFEDACRSFTGVVCIGVKTRGSQAVLAPPSDWVIDVDDQLLVIASSCNVSRASKNSKPVVSRAGSKPIRARAAALVNEADNDGRPVIICIGLSDDFQDILEVLDALTPPGTTIFVLSEKLREERDAQLEEVTLENIRLQHLVGSRTSVQNLAGLPLTEATAILILAEGSSRKQDGLGTAGGVGDEIAADDSITADSTCLSVMVTITGIVEGRFGHPPQQHKRARILCEVLDSRTDYLLARNSALQQHAFFFRTNALETAMFALASANPVAFNALNRMLPPCDGGHLEVVPVHKYIAPRNSMDVRRSEYDPLGDYEGYCYWDIHERVRQNGDLLVGWSRALIPTEVESQDITRDGIACLAPNVLRSKKLTWHFQDELLILRAATKRQISKGTCRRESGLGPEECMDID